jgi:16S rRNA (guanine966-N2)-methyltransferase
VLDLYAGSGALGIEALSRGASEAVFVESGRAAAGIIRRNLESLAMTPNSTLVQLDTLIYLRRSNASGASFDLIFADPPYTIDEDFYRILLEAISRSGLLAEDGRLILEHPAPGPAAPVPQGMTLEAQRRYGDTAVSIFARSGSPRD